MSFTPLLQLKKFPDIPVSTREEARESRPNPEQPRFRLLSREEGYFPCVFGKEFPAFLSHLKRRRSPQERRDELQGRATIPRLPQMSHFIPGKTDFPALPRLSSRGSTHATVAVGKPCAKASRESHRSLDPREGKHDTARDPLPWGVTLVASGKASPHASCSGASRDSSPVDAGA